MTTALVSQEKVREAIEEHGLQDVQVGDYYITDSYYKGYARIDRFFFLKDKYPCVLVSYSGDGENWSEEHTGMSTMSGHITSESFRRRWIKLDCTPAEHIERALNAARDPSSLNPYKDIQPSDETALVPVTSKAATELMLRKVEQVQIQIEAIHRSIEIKKQQIYAVVSQMSTFIGHLNKVIGLFELYLGVHEEIVQVMDGLPAPANEPITFRQLLLYWDEEQGDPRAQNDYRTVEGFTEWLRLPGNLDKMLPEKKGIVAIQPSRQHWDYGDYGGREHGKNRMTYLLCRNGDRVYRIWTSTVTMGKLFPGPDEITMTDDEARQRIIPQREETEKFEGYRKQVLLLQGIIDRTPIFQPLPHEIKLPDPNTYGGMVNMIWDADNLLDDGHARFKAWQEKINSQITYGSRVVISWRVSRRNLNDRFMRYYSKYSQNMPDSPPDGVYAIEKIIPNRHCPQDKMREHMLIRYRPGGTIYGGWGDYYGHERKNRVSFKLHRNDNFILHYNMVSLEDIDYFLQSRQDRVHYRYMMTFLYEIRGYLIEEMAYEKRLVDLIVRELECDEEKVWEAVEWWKTRNKWKRPINKDDAKAWRMIRRRLNNENL